MAKRTITPRGVNLMYMCNNCFRLFNEKKLKEINMRCPDCGDMGELVEIDGPIANDISLMNMKGYITEYCCAGHMVLDKGLRTNEFYVSFTPIVDDIVPWLLKHTPDGMKFDVYDITSSNDYCYKHRMLMSPRMHEFLDDLYEEKKVISVSENGEPSEYEYTGLTLDRYNMYAKWRHDIHQYIFRKWVSIIPNLHKNKEIIECLK